MRLLNSSLSGLSPYAFALLVTILMVALRLSLSPILGYQLPFVTLFLALFFAAWRGGLGPTLLATTVGVVSAHYLFFPPAVVFSFHDPVAVLGAGLFVASGVAVGILGESRLRVHARAQQAALEAQKSQERYRTLIEQTSEGIWRVELAEAVAVNLPPEEQIERFYRFGTLAECNDAMAHMYGYTSAAELTGAALGDLLPRSDPRNLEFLATFVRTGYRLTDAESHEIDRNGDERYFLNNLIGIVSDGHIVRAWGSQRDITSMKQSELAVQASDARFRGLFNSGMIGIAFWNRQVVTDANDSLLNMLGYTRADLAQKIISRERLLAGESSEDDKRARNEVEKTGWSTPYEKEFLRKDGSRIPVLVGAARLGEGMDDLAFFLLDLTERHRAEEQIRQAERMEVIGQLAGGMAHEANNQMSVVLGATEFILRRPDVPSDVRQDAEYIRAAAERTASITRQLLAFSRRQILQPQVLDLNELVKKLEPILRRTLNEEQKLVLRLSPDLAPVRADPIQLDQVVLNLTINARDAMPGGGVLTIETRNVELGTEFNQVRSGVTLRPGSFTMLSLSDTGYGIDQETMKHVFEPFFTTKGVGKGSGLGLAMVYGIVKQSGGYIWPYSEPGLGTTFKVYLPSVTERPEAPGLRPTRESHRRSGATVLVVEDDQQVRTIAGRALIEAGFQVLEAQDGNQALSVVADHDQIDIVLTDLAMPELGGRELARRLSRMRPQLPVIFMSGYTYDDLTRRGLLEPGIPYVEKPFSPQALAHMIHDVLKAGAAKAPAIR